MWKIRFRAPCCAVILLLGLLGPTGAGQKAGTGGNDAVKFQRLKAVFAPSASPRIQGKPWVRIDTGPADFPQDLAGWLLRDGGRQLVLLDWDGDIHQLRKPALHEARPNLKTGKNGTLSLDAIFATDHSVAWHVHVESYVAKCQKFLADGLPKDKESTDAYGMAQQRFGLVNHIIDAAHYASTAYQLGHHQQASALYAHALKAYRQFQDRYEPGTTAPLHRFVAERMASLAYSGAVLSARDGVARSELQKGWQKIAAFPYHRHRDEARAMIKHYQSLLEEDARWVEPSPATLAKRSTNQKVTYWLYHLRDLDVQQCSDPGTCCVFDDWRIDLGGGEKKPNAAVELKNIGFDAIPGLIEHLDDARPTRCEGHWRRYWPEMHYVLRYGDCCQQIFEAITGYQIYHPTSSGDYPIRSGQGKQCKVKAREWWKMYQMAKALAVTP